MAEGQINEQLSNIIFMYVPAFGRVITKQAVLNLPTTAIECQVENVVGDTYALMKTALSKCGAILEENIEDGTISGVILSGAAMLAGRGFFPSDKGIFHSHTGPTSPVKSAEARSFGSRLASHHP